MHDKDELVEFNKVYKHLERVQRHFNNEFVLQVLRKIGVFQFIHIVYLPQVLYYWDMRTLELMALLLQELTSLLIVFLADHIEKEANEDWENYALQVFFILVKTLVNIFFE